MSMNARQLGNDMAMRMQSVWLDLAYEANLQERRDYCIGLMDHMNEWSPMINGADLIPAGHKHHDNQDAAAADYIRPLRSYTKMMIAAYLTDLMIEMSVAQENWPDYPLDSIEAACCAISADCGIDTTVWAAIRAKAETEDDEPEAMYYMMQYVVADLLWFEKNFLLASWDCNCVEEALDLYEEIQQNFNMNHASYLDSMPTKLRERFDKLMELEQGNVEPHEFNKTMFPMKIKLPLALMAP